jgi:hypothetical protein
MDWKTVETQISVDDQNKWDLKVSGRQLCVSPRCQLQVLLEDRPLESLSLSDLAISQMCQRFDIPVKYYRRLPAEMKATVANHDITRQNGNSYLLRGKAEWIRAFLSADYVACDNTQIAETVRELLKDAVSLKSFVLEETHMFLKIISEEIVDRESGLRGGIMIGNSEVGLGSVSVEPFVFRKPCTNDLIVAQEKSFRHALIHLTARALSCRMAEAIGEAFKVASRILDAFLDTHAEPVPDPLEVIRKIAEERQLSQKFTDQVVSGYLAEPEQTRFGVINAFTRAAQELAPLQRIEMERFAGTLLDSRL